MPTHLPRKAYLFHELYQKGPLSNQELAELFELSPASITHLLQPLINLGMLKVLPAEQYPLKRNSGLIKEHLKRRKSTVYPNSDYGYIATIFMQNNRLILSCVNFALESVDTQTQFIDPASIASLGTLLCNAVRFVQDSHHGRLLGVGISLDPKADGKRLSLEIEQTLDLPCIAQSPANALVLYQNLQNATLMSQNLACLFIDQDEYLGIICNGGLYTGWQDSAGINLQQKIQRRNIYEMLTSHGPKFPEAHTWIELKNRINPKNAEKDTAQNIYDQCVKKIAMNCDQIFRILAPEYLFLYGPLAETCSELTHHISSNLDQEYQDRLILKTDWEKAMAIGMASQSIGKYLLN